MVALVGAGRGSGGLCPRPLPRQGGGPGPGDVLPSGGRLGRRGGGRPWLHSGGSSPAVRVFGAVGEVVGDGWQLNVINATEPFLQALAEAYRQMAMLAPTITIGHMNAAPTPADRGGHATTQDHAVRDTIEMLGLVDLTANLEGRPPHFPHQADAAPSRIDVCYGDPTTIVRAEARYGPLPLGPTGHSSLHIRLTIPNLPPSPPEDADKGLPPPLRMPPLHDKQAWSGHHRAIDRARRIRPDHNHLLTAMRTAAVACGFQQNPHTDNDRPPTALGDMLHDLWHAKQQLATLPHTHTPKSPLTHPPLQDADSPHQGRPAAVVHPHATAHRPGARTVCAT